MKINELKVGDEVKFSTKNDYINDETRKGVIYSIENNKFIIRLTDIARVDYRIASKDSIISKIEYKEIPISHPQPKLIFEFIPEIIINYNNKCKVMIEEI
jgi:hypothetical protein